MSESDIITGIDGSLARIRLNRPKAINALTLPMIQHIQAALTNTRPTQPSPPCSSPARASAAYAPAATSAPSTIMAAPASAPEFFAHEYRMNAHIAAYEKPYVALMDGITMGGGVGISSHGAIRIVTERTKLAMPETGIGFFPDVGGTWLLGQAHGETRHLPRPHRRELWRGGRHLRRPRRSFCQSSNIPAPHHGPRASFPPAPISRA